MTGQQFELFHAPQQHPWGCMWHALYAVTGECGFLEHVREIGTMRRVLLIGQAGYLLNTVFTDNFAGAAARAPSGLWGMVRHLAESSGYDLPYSVCFQMPGGMTHAVGVLIRQDGLVVVSDSLRPGRMTFTFEEFVELHYATRAYLVESLHPADLDAYPPEDAETAFETLNRQVKRAQAAQRSDT